MCQNEDIVAADAKLVGVGKWCQIRSGDQRCTLFDDRPLMWCRVLARAGLQRTQHFSLQIPTRARLHRAAMSRPPSGATPNRY